MNQNNFKYKLIDTFCQREGCGVPLVQVPAGTKYCKACSQTMRDERIHAWHEQRKQTASAGVAVRKAQAAPKAGQWGGKGDVCDYCGRLFLRRFEGQSFCRRPECLRAEARAERAKLAEVEG